jgi:hypothetical protein
MTEQQEVVLAIGTLRGFVEQLDCGCCVRIIEVRWPTDTASAIRYLQFVRKPDGTTDIAKAKWFTTETAKCGRRFRRLETWFK